VLRLSVCRLSFSLCLSECIVAKLQPNEPIQYKSYYMYHMRNR